MNAFLLSDASYNDKLLKIILNKNKYSPGKAVGKTNVGVQTTCSGVEAIFFTLTTGSTRNGMINK